MKSKENILAKLTPMKNGENVFIHTGEGSGFDVYCVNYKYYVLFSVGVYGGNEHLIGTYHKKNLDDVCEKILSWT